MRSKLPNPALLGPVVGHRPTSLLLLLLAGLQVGLVAIGAPGWPCPVLHATGWPCPGCGLTRATAALLRGDVRESLRVHALAPLALAGALAFAVGVVLPAGPRGRYAAAVARFERRTALPAVLLTLLFVYYAWRLVYFRADLARLAGG